MGAQAVLSAAALLLQKSDPSEGAAEWAAADLDALCAAVEFVSSPGSKIEWWPEYGCCLVAWRALGDTIEADPGALSLVVVGLDNWRYAVHRWGACLCNRCVH